MLDTLERGNLFLIPLDDQRQWYRYHHLFAEVLQSHLLESQPDQITALHSRAGRWFEHNGYRSDAIRHALAARDFEFAADLIELAWSNMDISYQSPTWLGWVKRLPEALLRNRPVLSVGYAWALLDTGEMETCESLLLDAERILDAPPEKMIVVDQEQFRSLPASIATARAYRSLAFGDVPATMKYARQALECLPADDPIRYVQATSLLGLAQYTSGDLQAAEQSLSEFHIYLQKTGDINTLIGITFLLADIRVTLGRLRDAESIYQQTLHLANETGGHLPLGTADLYRGLAELAVEHGDLNTAEQYLSTCQKLSELSAMTDWPYRLCISQARLKVAQGDLDGALALLAEAERVHIRGPLPDVRPIAASKSLIWLKQGRLDQSLGWASAQGLSVDNELDFLHEFELIILARVLIAAGKKDRIIDSFEKAAVLLDRLLKAAESGGRMGSVLHILLLQALAFQAQVDLPHALEKLERAMTLAEPQGYVRTFVDEGESMRLLIEKLSRNRTHPLFSYADRLLSAFAQPQIPLDSTLPHQGSNLIESLSERELQVLRLLRSELSGPDIAAELIVSLNTLRSHTKSIFHKLGVNNRRAAVRRAEELKLL